MKICRFKKRLLLITMALSMVSCVTMDSSIVVSDTYDRKNNQTVLSILPYGNVNIPGQWTKTKFNEVSRQHFFIDQDSTVIAVARNPQKKYPFYKPFMSNKDFAREFFIWEKEYFENLGLEVLQDTSNSGEDFIIWTTRGKDTNTMFLYGAKDEYAFNFAIYTTNWNDETRKEFLKELLQRNHSAADVQ